jgi:quercetin dioxygenase-like cupin family protein
MGRMQTARWAEYVDQQLKLPSGEMPIQMAHSDGTALPLLSHNGFGADVIRFAANKGVQRHIHEGDHILFVLSGEGIVEYDGEEFDLTPGIAYFVPGNISHAIRANTALVLIAVGNQHQPAGSEKRLEIV